MEKAFFGLSDSRTLIVDAIRRLPSQRGQAKLEIVPARAPAWRVEEEGVAKSPQCVYPHCLFDTLFAQT